MLTAFLYMLAINTCVGLAGFALGRLTAPPTSVTINHHGDELPARFRAAEAHQFDLRPSAKILTFKLGDHR